MLETRMRISSIILLLFAFSVSYGQSKLVTGVVTDSTTGETLPGANIRIVGGNQGTISDFEGYYEIEVPNAESELEVSFIGYEPMSMSIGDKTTIDFNLGLNTSQLEEIIVVGYGTQKKKEVIGAISRIEAEDISATPTLRLEQALQGRSAGVMVTSLSGQPGEEPTVRIRGTGTTGNARPLYIVDGLAVGNIDYLNPSDIETIDVLKDAASAAIYGARAANGVILITTKTGTSGKLQLQYSTYYGIQNVANKIDMLNADQYKMIMNEGARNAGLSEPFDLLEISPHDTDWQEALFQKNAPMMEHQLGITGGGEKSNYAATMSFFTQEGIIGGPRSNFDRYTARINSTHKVNAKLKFGSNLAYTHLETRSIGSNQSFNGAFSSALNLDPLTPVFETNENNLSQAPFSTEPVIRDGEGNAYGISEYVGAEIVNPLALLEIDNDKTRKDELVGNVFAEFEAIKGLKLRTSYGVDLAYVLFDGFRPLFYLNGAQLNVDRTSVDKRIERYFTWQWENTVTYEKKINDHKFSVLAGTTASEFNFEDLFGFNSGVPVDDPDNVYLNLATDTLWNARGGARESSLFSVFGRLNYSYKEKYSVSAVVRRDGSSKFGANNRFGIFPSIGVAWVLSEEPFMRNQNIADYVKVRASYGINGNQEIGDFQFVSIVDNTRGYDFGGGTEVGSSPLFIENADIRWEQSEQYDIGLDVGFFNNRLQATIDVYQKTTKDLLENIPIPAHVGNNGPIANVGSVENKGIELSLTWRNAKGGFKYDIGINGAYNKNTMTLIGNPEKIITGASWAIAGAVTRAEEGLPIAFFYGYETDGLFQNQSEIFTHFNNEGELLQPNAVPGDVRFVDVNGDGIIDPDDRTMIGNALPDYTFGVNAGFEYKNVDVSIFFQGQLGNEIFNGSQRQDLRFINRPVSFLDRWTGEGTSTTTPRYTWSDTNNNYRVSDLYIENGSFARIKNLQIGYSIPVGLIDNIGASAWRFYVSVENLFTLTNYSGADPEIGSLIDGNTGAPNPFDFGIDRAIYPQARTVRFGTSVTF